MSVRVTVVLLSSKRPFVLCIDNHDVGYTAFEGFSYSHLLRIIMH
jgi:hypothetical protein